MNNEDLTIASLAKIVGSELSKVDAMTERIGQQGSANKIDPRSLILKNNTAFKRQAAAKGVVYHQGKAFYAGPDESYVQNQFPDPPAAAISPPVVSPAQIASTSVPVSAPLTKTSLLSQDKDTDDQVIKLLKSIDKSLKTIVKNLTPNKE